MGLLDGKRLLLTGVLTEASIAYTVAKLAQQEGADIVLSGFGRGLGITERIAKRLPEKAPVIELDVTDEEHLAALPERVGAHLDALDGVLHAIAFAPAAALGGNFMTATWDDVATAVHVSAFSLAALTRAALPMLTPGSGVVGLDFDATVAWPAYDWMGVAKAGLESTARYLARDLGPKQIRVNLVAAGPLRTIAAKSIDGFEAFEQVWGERAPLGWDIRDTGPAARACVALMSDWFPATTGEIIHVDGGFHAVGA
ncbi:MAG: short-chain dehydrogenase/reductase [Mycobacterium sp.]|nr:short-chain dehydrogenase/reductase [Mycobacterium sp.]